MERFKITYKRGHGPGGQHKNKIESCVVIIDSVTGFKETCQDTRSQAKNKQLAMERINTRLAEDERLEKNQRQNELRIKLIGSATVVRTYNYQRNEAKDHRTGKRANLKQVLNGNLNLLHDRSDSR